MFVFISHREASKRSDVEEPVPGEVGSERKVLQAPKPDFRDLAGVVAFAVDVPENKTS